MKTLFKVSILPFALGLLLISAFAACEITLGDDSPVGESGNTTDQLDVDGDGEYDGVGIDSDGDGIADGLDTDGDGEIDEDFPEGYVPPGGEGDGDAGDGDGDGDTDSGVEPNEGVDDLSFLSEIELEVIKELNYARTKPAEYAELIEDRIQYYDGNVYWPPEGGPGVSSTEGVSALEEAVEALEAQTPLEALKASHGLYLAAKDHVEDQYESGATGHTGGDGSTFDERIERYGTWQVTIGENIAYGTTSARDIVLGLIVDDGVPSRGHRTNIYSSSFTVVGVSYAEGGNAAYGSVCVHDYAGGFIEE